MIRRIAVVLFAGIVLLGCDANDPAGPGPSLLPADARYLWSVEERPVETDSTVFRLEESVRVRTVEQGAALDGYEDLFVIETTAASGGTSRSWYEETELRLREVAYADAGATPPAQPRGTRRSGDVFVEPFLVAELLRNRDFDARRGGDEDSVTVRSDPRVVYELPLEVGRAWVSFTEPFYSTRKVVGRETVTVEAGTFESFVIETEIDFVEPEAEFLWRDYVVPGQGLVLRTMESVGRRHPEGGDDPSPPFRLVERLELVAGR